jgi:hypothetical protein
MSVQSNGIFPTENIFSNDSYSHFGESHEHPPEKGLPTRVSFFISPVLRISPNNFCSFQKLALPLPQVLVCIISSGMMHEKGIRCKS